MEDIKDTVEETSNNEAIQNSQEAVCTKERDAWKEKYVRVQADLDNFSKRVDKERIQWRSSGQNAVLMDLLPVIDNVDRAWAELEKKEIPAELQPWFAGFDMLRKSFYKLLENYEIKEVPSNIPFDPHYHEALMEVESPQHKQGQIVAVLQKGFMCKEQILRPAKVSVAK